MKQRKKTDVVIVGGGHAGVEASNIISKLGKKNILITMDLLAIGRMSCNPAIGGVAKGQIVREIDMLGGLMGFVADQSGLQYKLLNKSKGRSVWSPRAQIDKRVYERIVSDHILNQKNTDVLEGEGAIPTIYIGQAFGYLVGYVGATMSVALWLFEDRELS